jgi:predicted PurR-regulated permease PerM
MTRFKVTLTTRGAILLVMLGIGFVFLWTVRPVLPPLIWAFIVAYIFDPLVRWGTRRLRLPRLVVVALLFAIMVGALIWGFIALRPVLVREMRDLIQAVPRIVADVQEYMLGSAPIDILGVVVDIGALKEELNRAVQTSVGGIGRQAIPFVVRAVGSLFHVILFLIASFYLLLDLDKLGQAVVNFLPRRWRLDVIPLLAGMEGVLGNYIRGQVLLIVIQILASGVVLSALNVRYALLLAIVTGVVEIFPVIGPWTAGAIAVSVSLTQQTTLFGGDSTMLAVAVALAYFVMRQLEDIFVIPNVVGKVMEMHPLLVLFALTAGSYLGGILGLLIAVPIAAVVKLDLGFVRDKFMEEERINAAEKRAGNQPVDADEDENAG